MDKGNDIIDAILLTIGGGYSLANIQSTLGIVILVIQCLWLGSKFVIKVIDIIKNKNGSIDDLDEDIDDITGVLEDFINKQENQNNKNEESGDEK